MGAGLAGVLERNGFVLFLKPGRSDALDPAAARVALETRGEATVVGRDLTVTGVLESNGEVVIHGRVEGHVQSRSVTIAETGEVLGSVIGEHVCVHGVVNGPVRATNVEIARTARVVGNITHFNLSVEPGAYLEGRRPWRPRPLGNAHEQFTFAETN